MNSKIAKTLRKFARLRGYKYKAVKKAYQITDKDLRDRTLVEIREEISKFVNAV